MIEWLIRFSGALALCYAADVADELWPKLAVWWRRRKAPAYIFTYPAGDVMSRDEIARIVEKNKIGSHMVLPSTIQCERIEPHPPPYREHHQAMKLEGNVIRRNIKSRYDPATRAFYTTEEIERMVTDKQLAMGRTDHTESRGKQ